MTTAREILDCQMQPNAAQADTVRDYLVSLLVTLWEEGEGFSGKRPFGDSGWEYELYEALGRAGFLVDTAEADRLILDAIKELQ